VLVARIEVELAAVGRGDKLARRVDVPLSTKIGSASIPWICTGRPAGQKPKYSVGTHE
jgi:hypothetical protein